MAQWMNILDISEAWKKADKHDISIQELAKIIAEKLDMLHIPDDDLNYEKDDISEQFKDLINDEECDEKDFNFVMEQLYDWADTPLDNRLFGGSKLCWIKTYF